MPSGYCRFRDDTAADIASLQTNAASPIARNCGSRGARVTDYSDKTPRRAGLTVCADNNLITLNVFTPRLRDFVQKRDY